MVWRARRENLEPGMIKKVQTNHMRAHEVSCLSWQVENKIEHAFLL